MYIHIESIKKRNPQILYDMENRMKFKLVEHMDDNKKTDLSPATFMADEHIYLPALL